MAISLPISSAHQFCEAAWLTNLNLNHLRCVWECKSETRWAIVLLLTRGGPGRFRVTCTGQVDAGDESISPDQSQEHPVPADLHVALPAQPMGIDKTTSTLPDDCRPW